MKIIRKLVACALFVLAPACALGSLEDTLSDVADKIDNLHMAECMDTCSDKANVCLYGTNKCIDTCESDYKSCAEEVQSCKNSANVECTSYTGSQYYSCISLYNIACNVDCGEEASTCGHTCGAMLAECLFSSENSGAYSQCVSDCVKEMEDALKGISI
jgi:hypothetical protein